MRIFDPNISPKFQSVYPRDISAYPIPRGTFYGATIIANRCKSTGPLWHRNWFHMPGHISYMVKQNKDNVQDRISKNNFKNKVQMHVSLTFCRTKKINRKLLWRRFYRTRRFCTQFSRLNDFCEGRALSILKLRSLEIGEHSSF